MKTKYYLVVFCILQVILPGKNLFGQSDKSIFEQYRFKSITVDDGLNNNLVRGLCQDKYGFIWIGTRAGISRFDGYVLKQYDYYYNDTTPVSFTETRIFFCDTRGVIWAGGGYGVCRYNPDKDRFEKFIDPEDPKRISYCSGIDEDSKGN